MTARADKGEIETQQIAPALIIKRNDSSHRLVLLRSLELLCRNKGESSKQYGDTVTPSSPQDFQGELPWSLNGKPSIPPAQAPLIDSNVKPALFLLAALSLSVATSAAQDIPATDSRMADLQTQTEARQATVNSVAEKLRAANPSSQSALPEVKALMQKLDDECHTGLDGNVVGAN